MKNSLWGGQALRAALPREAVPLVDALVSCYGSPYTLSEPFPHLLAAETFGQTKPHVDSGAPTSVFESFCGVRRKQWPSSMLASPAWVPPAPYSLHPSPYTLQPTAYSLQPTAYTLDPTPYTLDPRPQTLDPRPASSRRRTPRSRRSRPSARCFSGS